VISLLLFVGTSRDLSVLLKLLNGWLSSPDGSGTEVKRTAGKWLTETAPTFRFFKRI
jgi:hypothetical protein